MRVEFCEPVGQSISERKPLHGLSPNDTHDVVVQLARSRGTLCVPKAEREAPYFFQVYVAIGTRGKMCLITGPANLIEDAVNVLGRDQFVFSTIHNHQN